MTIAARVPSNERGHQLRRPNGGNIEVSEPILAFVILVAATALESFGDAVVRIGLFNRSGVAQATTLIGGGILLFGYGALLNFAPVPFERVVGLYIATLCHPVLRLAGGRFCDVSGAAEHSNIGRRSVDCNRWLGCHFLAAVSAN
jgi:hypothetical protein